MTDLKHVIKSLKALRLRCAAPTKSERMLKVRYCAIGIEQSVHDFPLLKETMKYIQKATTYDMAAKAITLCLDVINEARAEAKQEEPLEELPYFNMQNAVNCWNRANHIMANMDAKLERTSMKAVYVINPEGRVYTTNTNGRAVWIAPFLIEPFATEAHAHNALRCYFKTHKEPHSAPGMSLPNTVNGTPWSYMFARHVLNEIKEAARYERDKWDRLITSRNKAEQKHTEKAGKLASLESLETTKNVRRKRSAKRGE